MQEPEYRQYRTGGDEPGSARGRCRGAMVIGQCRPVRMHQPTVIVTIPASTGDAAANTDNDQHRTGSREQRRADCGADPWDSSTLGEHVLDDHAFP